jgi:fatty-acyl-CoA synthase
MTGTQMISTHLASIDEQNDLANAPIDFTRLALTYQEIQDGESARWKALDAVGVSSWADVFEVAADTHPERLAVIQTSDGRAWTYADLDRAADRIAFWAKSNDEPSVALRRENSFAFLAAAIGLAKAGVLAVLINEREPDERAAALATAAGAATTLGNSLPGLTAAPSIETLIDGPHIGRFPAALRNRKNLDDPCWIIFTSGTSGRSKGARFSHRRMIGAGIAWSLRAGLKSSDRCYTPLPLCHGNAMAIAFSSCVTVGAAIVLRERFSARSFIGDIRTHSCTAAVYIGELWRYLDAIPVDAGDADAGLRIIFGNGLGRELWARTIRRYGITNIVEHYGATELPAAALTNWTGRPGYCGFIPPEHPDHADVALVDSDGRRVPSGETGEILMRVKSGAYHGYVDPRDDAAKLYRDLFEPGDLWWRSGDLLTLDAHGFFAFIERTGDGFRWKGENVAACDVEEAIRETGLVGDVAVFGVTVPNHDGKAGMASIVTVRHGGLPDLAALGTALRAALPPYAVPRFLRIRWQAHPTTATLKIAKANLARDAFENLGQDPVFILDGDRYVPMTRDMFDELCAGRRKLS